MTESEVPLRGGNLTPVVRVGDTVRRIAGPWTPTIHRYLRHLRRAGIDWVPTPSGMDDEGREVLSFLPGTVPTYPLPSWVWRDEFVIEAGERLRQLHDASETFDAAEAVWRLPAHQPAEVICHNDFAPYNFVIVDDKIGGVIDFDTASPGPRIWDVAYLAHRLIPLNDRDRPDDSATERARRLSLLLDAYGADFTAAETIATAVARLRELADFSDDQAALRGRPDLAEHAALYRADAEALSRDANDAELTSR